jgi:hypothetical protein
MPATNTPRVKSLKGSSLREREAGRQEEREIAVIEHLTEAIWCRARIMMPLTGEKLQV